MHVTLGVALQTMMTGGVVMGLEKSLEGGLFHRHRHAGELTS